MARKIIRMIPTNEFSTSRLIAEGAQKSIDMIQSQVKRIERRSGKDSKRARQARDIANQYIQNINNTNAYKNDKGVIDSAMANYLSAANRASNNTGSRAPKYYVNAKNNLDSAYLTNNPNRRVYDSSVYAQKSSSSYKGLSNG